MSMTILNRKRTKNSPVVLTREGKRSLIGKNWLAQLDIRVGAAHKIGEYNNAVNNITSQNITIEKLKTFSKLFTGERKIKGHQIKIGYKKYAKITQQKGRRVP